MSAQHSSCSQSRYARANKIDHPTEQHATKSNFRPQKSVVWVAMLLPLTTALILCIPLSAPPPSHTCGGYPFQAPKASLYIDSADSHPSFLLIPTIHTMASKTALRCFLDSPITLLCNGHTMRLATPAPYPSSFLPESYRAERDTSF